ncbi:MAG TPA: GNAT family N-acetyltransferase [Alloacidobacterium sp.]|nr:GNAT family N-acetyltransferase [Alloacidobacterium sp.]
MSSALQFEILDLRHFSASSLRPVLDEESRLWSDRLRWDYRTSADLLLQYLDSRVLPGYVAVENGRIAGYVFCVYEEHKAIIGDVFSLSSAAADVEDQLLRHLIELLLHSPGIDRIECQLLLHPHGLHAEIFREAGFKLFRRLFMELDLSEFEMSNPRLPRPEGLALTSWRENDFHPAGYLIADAYGGHLDSFINDQYRTVGGSLRFLHNIVRFPGCGLFDPAASRTLTRTADGSLAGVLLCSRVRDDVGHVTQVCVAKNQRQLGLGRLLIEECAANLRGRGFRGLTLTVTEENTNAVELYRRIGFVEKHSFDAMVWDRSWRWPAES